MVRPSPPETTSVGFTTFTQLRMTSSTTTLKIVGYRGSPCVTPQYPLNRRPKYLPALATMVSRFQYVRRSRTVLGLTLYSAISYRGLSSSEASQAFRRSRNISKRTASLMAVSCWSSFASRVEVPVPRPTQNLWRISWNDIAAVTRRLRRLATAF